MFVCVKKEVMLLVFNIFGSLMIIFIVSFGNFWIRCFFYFGIWKFWIFWIILLLLLKGKFLDFWCYWSIWIWVGIFWRCWMWGFFVMLMDLRFCWCKELIFIIFWFICLIVERNWRIWFILILVIILLILFFIMFLEVYLMLLY